MENLKAQVREVLNVIGKDPVGCDRYRCHDYARLIASGLKGIDVKVVDGVATYDGKFLEKLLYQPEQKKFDSNNKNDRRILEEAAKMLKTTVEKLVEDQNKKKEKPIYPTVSVKHSWCETDDSIIDYHPCFQFELEPGHITGIKDYLTIRKKGNHPSIQFNPNGKLINLGVAKFIYAPIFPWFFTKLRV